MYDAIIIGAGPGGYSCAIEIAVLGGRAAVIEKDKVGGTCANYGCIPTKSLINSVSLIEELKQASRKGIEATFTVDFGKIIKRKNRTVDTIVRGMELNLQEKGIDLFRGDARIVSENRICVGDSEIEAGNIVIATGSEPVEISSGENMVTSRELLEITSVPERLVIIGGGVTGLEFAMIFQLLGSRVTIIEARERLLPDLDADLSAEIERIVKRKGITVRKGKRPRFDHKLILDGEEISYDTALMAVGRRPCSHGLEDIRLDTVNGKMQTEVNTIFAVGDVTGRNQLAHVATMQGIVAAHTIMGREREMDYGSVPNCIYTLPEIASVGISETKDHDVYKTDYAANARARCSDKLYGFLKIVVNRKTGQIEGVHIIGENATDLIATAVTMIQKKMTLNDMKNLIFPHPTFSELFIDAVK